LHSTKTTLLLALDLEICLKGRKHFPQWFSISNNYRCPRLMLTNNSVYKKTNLMNIKTTLYSLYYNTMTFT
jgi:hypothetical protein